MEQPTPYDEANALLHITSDDDEAAREVLGRMSPAERRILGAAVDRLSDLIAEIQEGA
jgi:hypothetical protein